MDWKYLFTSFDGRINRGKFWAGVGVLIAVSIVASIIDAILGLQLGDSGLGVIGGIVAHRIDLFRARALRKTLA